MRTTVIVVCLLSTSPALAQLWTDVTETTIGETGEWSNKVELADINGDGNVDILFANGGNYNTPGAAEPNRVFLGQGGGDFVEATESVFGTGDDLTRVIKVRDVSGDGFPDIVVGGAYGTQTRLFLGSSGGSFSEATATHLPARPTSAGDLEIGDVDGDGDLDLVIADWGPGDPCTPTALACSPESATSPGGRVLLWTNDGSGRFSDATEDSMPESLVQWSWDLELVDTNNDYDLDIVVSCKACPGSFLFHNDGKGRFTDASEAMPAFTNNYEFEVLDLDGDGFMDLVTINDGEQLSGNIFDRGEHVFRGNGEGGFVDATSELWPDSANLGADDNAVVVLDADSDGDPDFLIGSLSGSDRLMVNDGRGVLSVVEDTFDGPETPGTLGIAVADLNGDGKLDVVQSQGELADTEHVFFGKDIPADTAAPKVSLLTQSATTVGGTVAVRARVHDNKTPNKPHDWQSVVLEAEVAGTTVRRSMTWYGENLWRADVEVASGLDAFSYRVCAVDAAGNETCSGPTELILGGCETCDGAGNDEPRPAAGCRTADSRPPRLAWLLVLGILVPLVSRRRRA